MKLRSSWSLVSLFAILVAVGIVSAVILIQQTQPAVPIQGGMTALCANTSATPNNVTLGSNGQETFSCDSAAPTTHPAFTTNGAVVVTPTVTGYAAPYNATGLFVFIANGAVNTGTCSSRTGATRINDGQSMALTQNSWNYCAKYEIVGLTGLPQFTVTWNL
ncbi:MAG: hypothetical protein E6K02_03895 [Methanobacteriota archaeon]|nr:MAG: hypothetical protein E6K02_03895 [Euryarchaeota archaeon]